MKQFINYVRAAFPLLYVNSGEENRVEGEIAGAVTALTSRTRKPFKLYVWSVTTGVVDCATSQAIPETNEPRDAVDAFCKMPPHSILVCRDLHMYLGEQNPELAILIRKIKDALPKAKKDNRVMVILGCRLVLPAELEKETQLIELKLPDRDKLSEIIDGLCEFLKLPKVANGGEREALIDAGTGLTTQEAENIFSLSKVETGDWCPKVVAREKAQTIKKSGILELYECKENMDSLGGMAELKTWISRRTRAFSKEAKEAHIPPPKGFIMLGPPGCGKSLAGKITANVLGVPLLKFDMGRVMGSLVGESERNMRTALALAEAISPCVLWCDEIDKGMSGSKSSGQTDGGTTARVFGTLLQWMQEKKASVFVVATSNDVSALPPEILRKGRFDEMWFIDLPNTAERKEIWAIQIKKYQRKPKDFDLDTLARSTDGFTGAEIEAVFVDALYSAFDEGKEPSDRHVSKAIIETVPLSRTMANDIENLRAWAVGRARRATAETVDIASTKGRSVLA